MVVQHGHEERGVVLTRQERRRGSGDKSKPTRCGVLSRYTHYIADCNVPTASLNPRTPLHPSHTAIGCRCAVPTCMSCASMLAPCSMRKLHTATCPFRTPKCRGVWRFEPSACTSDASASTYFLIHEHTKTGRGFHLRTSGKARGQGDVSRLGRMKSREGLSNVGLE